MFLIPPPPSWRVMEQKSWLNILQLSLLPTDLHDQLSDRNKRSTHPFLLLLFYSGVLWSSILQAEIGILPKFGISVSELCWTLLESFALLQNFRQTLGLWISLHVLEQNSALLNWRNSYIYSLLVCPLTPSWKGPCSNADFHWNLSYLGHRWSFLLH